jgi:hypothetical protein
MNLLPRKLISQKLAMHAIKSLDKLITDPSSQDNDSFGICWNLRKLLNACSPEKFNPKEVVVGRQSHGYFIVNRLSRNWEHYSGVPEYPVPCSDVPGGTWKGDALKLRINLMEHLISELKKI